MKLFSIVLLSLSLLALGCQTSRVSHDPNQPPVVESNTAGNVLEVAYFAAAAKHLKDNPKDLPRLTRIVERLQAFESAPADLTTFVLQLGAIGDEDVQLGITAGLMLYELELKRHIKVEQPAFTRAVSQRIRSGITRAIVFHTPVPPPAPGSGVLLDRQFPLGP